MDNELKLNIYNKLKINSNNSDIINLVLNNDITHSKNSNGIFLNISSLSNDNLMAINNILNNLKINIDDIDFSYIKNIDADEKKTEQVFLKKNYKKIKFNNLENKIFSFSF